MTFLEKTWNAARDKVTGFIAWWKLGPPEPTYDATVRAPHPILQHGLPVILVVGAVFFWGWVGDTIG